MSSCALLRSCALALWDGATLKCGYARSILTFSCSDCARSRGRCRSRSPESRSARSVESNRVARAERATGDQSRRPQQTESGPCVSLTVYARNGTAHPPGVALHTALRSARNGAHATIHTQPHSDYHVAHSQWYMNMTTHVCSLSLSLSLSPYTRGHISVATTCALGLFCALALWWGPHLRP